MIRIASWARPRVAVARFAQVFAATVVGAGVSFAGSDEIRVTPAKVDLLGPDAVQQLVVEGASDRDLTARSTFESLNPAVASVDATGLVRATGEGTASIRVTSGGVTSEATVTVREFDPGPPIHFANQVVPIFTKLGCNSGGCHGKASGQNGFRLSLLGFEPTLDYETLVNEGRGRRVFPAAPEQSLLLQKATAKVPHGGGRKIEPDSYEYRILLRWVAAGMPVGKSDAPTVAKIEVYPPARRLVGGGKQQVAVTAVYTDGRREDVTRWAQYQTNDQEVATVADGGQVEARGLSGQAAIMARYQGQVAVFRATVPLVHPPDPYPEFQSAGFVDTLALAQWKDLGIAPSDLCTDAEFLRRASLDITGTLPAPKEYEEFAASNEPDKRAKLIDRLLDRPDYASFFANKWADILRNKREGNAQFQNATYRFHDWLRQSLAANMPYDQMVRGVLAASGTPETAPPVVWYRNLRAPDAFVDDTAQVFLGMRLQCAKCHHHPFEKWSQDDYYGFAAFFARIGRKPSMSAQRAGRIEEVIFASHSGSVSNPKTGQTMQPRGLGEDKALTISSIEDPRAKLVDWLSEPKNPFFAKALVNRYWAHFFGRGLVEPMDDMRVTNPPSNPALLDALADDFVKNKYDLKHLIRTLCTSRAYGLSSVPNESNAKDKQSFARRYPKRMQAEVLLDAVSLVTGTPTDFSGLPQGTRAIDLPDESVGTTFLDTFGRPKRDTPCECERMTDASLGQSLMLLNSQEVQAKLTGGNSRASQLAADARPDETKIAEVFWLAFGRTPSSSETAAAVAHIAKLKDKKQAAYEDIIWALVNAKEFQFND